MKNCKWESRESNVCWSLIINEMLCDDRFIQLREDYKSAKLATRLSSLWPSLSWWYQMFKDTTWTSPLLPEIFYVYYLNKSYALNSLCSLPIYESIKHFEPITPLFFFFKLIHSFVSWFYSQLTNLEIFVTLWYSLILVNAWLVCKLLFQLSATMLLFCSNF